MCGLVGMVSRDADVAPFLYIGLGQLQHRGKEGAGMVTAHLGYIGPPIRGMGEVMQVCRASDLERISGTMGIGHVWYGTAGAGGSSNVQPIEGTFRGHTFYLAHNGNLVNTKELRAATNCRDVRVSDTRLVVQMISQSTAQTFEDALVEVVQKLRGSFNFLILFDSTIYAVTDRFGFHPLQFGTRGEDFVIASESCVFDHIGACFVRDIKPGEIVSIRHEGVSSFFWTKDVRLRFDIFEFVYFARPDSVLYGVEVGSARRAIGMNLADEHPIFDADVVVPIADSGAEAGLGYARGMRAQKLPIEFDPYALLRSHAVSRTFIEPVQERRSKEVHLKFNPRRTLLKGKRIVLVDDSLVRGTTLPEIARRVKECGAQSVSAVIASPMYGYPDVYGVDTYRVSGELLAKRLSMDKERIRAHCGLAHLEYVSIRGMMCGVLSARNEESPLWFDTFYLGPFIGEYPDGKGDYA